MLKIGYIGLGLMGKSIAKNILRAGYPLIAHNRSRAVVEELKKEGAIEAFSPAETAALSDVVFTNLPDSPDVEMVALGKNGILEGGRKGLIFIDNSTIKPSVSRKIADEFAKAGIEALDAPVSGGEIGARNGTLSIMVGGKAEVLETVRPILEKIGKTITLVGDSGAGQIAKAANQIMVAAQMVAMGELLLFAQKAGADPEKVIQAIKSGAAQCWTLDVKPQRLFEGNREPGFKSSMQYKDMNIVMETAREFGVPLPSASLDTQLYAAMVEQGFGSQDNSAIIAVLEQMAAIRLHEGHSTND